MMRDHAAGMPDQGMLAMLSARLESAEQRSRWWPTAALMLLTLIGFVAISGAHLGAAWGDPFPGSIPRPLLYATATATLALISVICALTRRAEIAALSAMLTAYLLGNLLSGAAHVALDPRAAIESVWISFIVSRLLYVAAVSAPMLLVLLLWYRGSDTFHFGFGTWSGTTRLGRGDEPRSWRYVLAFFAIAICIPLFLLLQALVGFGPLTSGRLLALILPIVLMALSNAFAEELIFRGFMHGAAIRAVGPACGIWAVGILFGLHHWGMSFGAIASLPMSLALGAGSVLFAKSVIETRGLGWAIIAHALVDVCLYSAYYVAVPD